MIFLVHTAQLQGLPLKVKICTVCYCVRSLAWVHNFMWEPQYEVVVEAHARIRVTWRFETQRSSDLALKLNLHS